MTENKQIIIHSIDVSECEHITYKDSLNPMCGNTGICCYGRRDCYFKQLKHKQQECDRLKHDNEYEVGALEKTIDNLTAENEELKKQLQAQRAFTRHEQKLIYCVAYDETCKTGNDCKQEKCIFKDNIKLKQTLAEIKEFAITGLEGFCSKCSRKECEDNNCIETAIRDILQLISEVENDRQD